MHEDRNTSAANRLGKPDLNEHPAAHASLRAFAQRALAAVRRPGGRTSAQHGAGGGLAQIIAGLESLNGQTEHDFLTIGGKLSQFQEAAGGLASDMTALSDLIQGEEGLRASRVLTDVLDELRQIETRARAGNRELKSASEGARQVRRTFSGFQNTVGTFRVLGSLTRVEAARLGRAGTDFSHLAGEVGSLTESIEASGEGIVETAAVLESKIETALTKVTSLYERELKELPGAIVEVLESLATLADRQRHASKASQQCATEFQGVSAAIADLITAIQFQDITRQQIEHVLEALRRVNGDVPAGNARSVEGWPGARAVLGLQSSQLSNAAQTFASSAGRVEGNLDRIAASVGQMAERSRTLMGLSADEQDSFFLQMERRFTSILEVAGKCASVETETRAMLTDLDAAMARMREHAEQARGIGIRVQRIAINAAIRAIEIGDSGNALSVIAARMQNLALETNGITDDVTAALDAISVAATGWSCAAVPSAAPDAPERGADTLAELRDAVLKLHSASEAAFSHLNRAAGLSERLSGAIRAARAEFAVGAVFAEAIGSARDRLRELSGTAEAMAGAVAGTAKNGQLEDYAALYTMHSERAVHQSVAECAAGESTIPGTAAVGSGEELEENVELF